MEKRISLGKIGKEYKRTTFTWVRNIKELILHRPIKKRISQDDLRHYFRYSPPKGYPFFFLIDLTEDF